MEESEGGTNDNYADVPKKNNGELKMVTPLRQRKLPASFWQEPKTNFRKLASSPYEWSPNSSLGYFPQEYEHRTIYGPPRDTALSHWSLQKCPDFYCYCCCCNFCTTTKLRAVRMKIHERSQPVIPTSFVIPLLHEKTAAVCANDDQLPVIVDD